MAGGWRFCSPVFAQSRGTNTGYLLKNARVDTVKVLRNGAVAGSEDYDPYGNDTDWTCYSSYGYANYYYDSYSGFYYLRNRFYDPSIGRFVSEDPVYDGINWYAYAGNNPVMFVDPLGLAPTPKEAAYISEHIYNYNQYSNEEERVVQGWRLIDVWYGREGMKMGFYIPDGDDWQNPSEYVIAFKGTTITDVGDWKNNVEQLLSPKSADMWDAINYSIGFVNSKEGYEITFVGHSKGVLKLLQRQLQQIEML